MQIRKVGSLVGALLFALLVGCSAADEAHI